MGDNVDSSGGNEVGRFKEAMQIACRRVEIVTCRRLVSPKPLGSSTTTRRPALTSKGRTFRQAIQLSGHPGSSNTGSPVPAVT